MTSLPPSSLTYHLVEPLTAREVEILTFFSEGFSNREIAERLFIADTTVKWYNQRIYDKFSLEKPYRKRRWVVHCARDLSILPALDEKAEVAPPGDNPYKGLDAFQQEDAPLFFGREAFVEQLLTCLSENGPVPRFLAVVGPSGSGKSSVVRAGLIPALQEGRLPGAATWAMATMFPRVNPFYELGMTLQAVAEKHQPDLLTLLQRDAYGLARCAPLILSKDRPLLLIIDQFEEIFTLVDDTSTARRFMDLIYAAVTDPRSTVRVVITLRADFLDRPLMYPDFSWLVQTRTAMVGPMAPDDLERAITLPADQAHVTFEPGVVARLVAEASEQPGAMPLLEFMLTELYDARIGPTITMNAYEEIGGLRQSLAAQADKVFADLDSEQQEAARQLFLRLITLGEGTEDVRRRVPTRELASLDVPTETTEHLTHFLAANRLLTLDLDPTTKEPAVEVAHEALIREWDRLRAWLDESRNDVRMERLLASAVDEWHRHDREGSYLMRGAKLAQYQAWRETTDLALTTEENRFLDASLVERDRQQRRRRVVGNLALITAAVVTIAMATLALWANSQRTRAEDEKQHAEISEQEALREASIGLAALAEKELGGTNPERGVLLALEALEYYPYTPQAKSALAHTVEEYRAFRVLEAGASIGNYILVAALSPDGRRVAAGAIPAPKSVIIWDATTGSELLSVEKHGEFCNGEVHYIADLAWSPSGERIATVAHTNAVPEEDCGTMVWDTTSGETLLTLSGYDGLVLSVNWSPDGATILTSHDDGTVRLWDAESGAVRLMLMDDTGGVNAVCWSPDGSRIATGSAGGIVRLWDAESGAQQRVFTGHVGAVRSVAWSSDSSHLVTGGDDGLPRVWDVASGETVFVLRGHTSSVDVVDWSSDGSRIASHGADATVKAWEAATGGFLYQLRNSTAGYAEFSPHGDQMLAGDTFQVGRVYLWDTSMQVPKLFGHTSGQEWGAWSPDGRLIATSGLDHTVRIWDAVSGQQLKVFNPPADNRFADWSPDGSRLVIPVSADYSYNVWDVRTGEVLLKISMPTNLGMVPHTARWSPDGSSIAGGHFHPESGPAPAYVWDAETGEVLSILQSDENCSQLPDWSPDSGKIATGCMAFGESGKDTAACIWDAATGQELMALVSKYGWSMRAMWSPDGRRILVTYEKGVAQIWNVESGETMLTFAGHSSVVWNASWSPDGAYIASSDWAGLVKTWNSQTAEEISSFAVPGIAQSIEWSPDGRYIIVTTTGSNEPIIKRVWTSTDDLVAHAYECCVTRDLTPEERAQFGLPER